MKIIMMILLGLSLAFGAVDFRKSSCFKNVDALAEVKGIGTKTIEKNRKNLKASKCKLKNK